MDERPDNNCSTRGEFGPEGDLLARLRQAVASERRQLLCKWVNREAAELLGLGPDTWLDAGAGLFSLGMDSLMAVKFPARLQKLLGSEFADRIPATLIFNYPTISSIVEFLVRDVLHLEDLPTSVRPRIVSAGESEPIAIVGMSCRFGSGASNIEGYWDLLANGRNIVREVPKDRFDIDKVYDPDPDAEGKTYLRHGSFIEKVDRFDAEFFGISPREARAMDPQQRLFLEVSWEALERAGESPQSLEGSKTGVFVGCMRMEYRSLLQSAQDHRELEIFEISGNDVSGIPGRVAYKLGLQGATLMVDTACSSSLVALHLACRELRAGGCDRALAGGVNLILTPDVYTSMSRTRAFSFRGSCATFDEHADGFVRGEGCGVVVLKRLKDAVANGDQILAVIRGTAVNHDGKSSSFTAPNGQAQEEVIREALRDAGLRPENISYVEAHGTGTPLGDPVEVGALAKVYGQGQSREKPLVIGSVKTNIGHTEAAAGIAGVIKTVLALQNEKIPKHLHFKRWNPNIPVSEATIVIPAAEMSWPRKEIKRIAGVSAFGLTGTNAHVIIEEGSTDRLLAADSSDPSVGHVTTELLTISARSEEALLDLAKAYLRQLLENRCSPLSDICHTSHLGRAHFEERLAIVAGSREELAEKLGAFLRADQCTGVARGKALREANDLAITFLFTGQGSQYPGMGRELYDTQPLFKGAIDRCESILMEYLDVPLKEALFRCGTELIHQTRYAQPCLFALEYALSELWKSWGIRPRAVMGHSVGEYVAACVAGVFTLEDGLKLIAHRGRLMQALPGEGAMVAIAASEAEVKEAIAPYLAEVSIAAVNGPQSVVISGWANKIEKVSDDFRRNGRKVKKLTVSHAFHSPQMDPMLDEFEEIARLIEFRAPEITLISNVTGRKVSNDEVLSHSYWRKHLREAIRFSDGIEALVREGTQYFLELGPSGTLTVMGEACVQGEMASQLRWTASLMRDTKEWAQVQESLGGIYAAGASVDWSSFEGAFSGRRKALLPTYPFQRKRYWVEGHKGRRLFDESEHPLLGYRVDSGTNKGQHIFQSEIDDESLPFLRDHQIYGNVIMPGAALFEMALSAGAKICGGAVNLRDVELEKPLALKKNRTKKVQLVLEPLADEGSYSFHILSRDAGGSRETSDEGDGDWVLHARGTLSRAPQPSGGDLGPALFEEIKGQCEEIAVKDFYSELGQLGLEYGNSFQGVEKLWVSGEEVLAQIQIPENLESGLRAYISHPAILDSCLHASMAIGRTALSRKTASLPIGLSRLVVYRTFPKRVWARISKRPRVSDSNGKLSELDLWIMDESGCLLGELNGLRAVDTPVEALMNSIGERGSVDEWFYEVKWKGCELKPPAAVKGMESKRWLIFADAFGVGERLAEILKQSGDDTITVRRESDSGAVLVSREGWRETWKVPLTIHHEDGYAQLLKRVASADGPVLEVVHLWSLDVTGSDNTRSRSIDEGQRLVYGSALALAKALLNESGAKPPRLSFVTKGAQAVDPAPADLQIGQASIWGLAKAIDLEHPELRCRRIDLDPGGTADSAIEGLRSELLAVDSEHEVAIRGGRRLAARLVRTSVARQGERDGLTEFSADATYLITGGLKGLGFAAARWMVERGARHLVLLGRSEPEEEVKAEIAGFTDSGVDIRVVRADVSAYEEVAEVMLEISQKMPPLKGVIHSAAVLDDGSLLDQNWERFSKVMTPKIMGAWNIHQLTRAFSLDFFVLFSSLSSMLGNYGQANYAAANQWLDVFAKYRNSKGLPCLSINWGAWSEIGLAKDLLKEGRIGMGGLSGIMTADGLEAFGRLIHSGSGQVGVFPIYWPKFISELPVGFETAFYSEVAPEVSQKSVRNGRNASKSSEVVSRLEQAPESERREILLQFLESEITQIMGLSEGTSVDRQKGLMSMGLDSLMAVQLRNRLKRALGEEYGKNVSATLIFNCPTLEKITDFLLSEMFACEAAPIQKEAKSPRIRPDEPIAIVGMSCRFPGKSNDVESYWKLLENGVDAITEVPTERFDIDEVYDPDPDAEGKTYLRRGSFIDDVDKFDPAFFAISPIEARAMDPQQRLLLEVSWEAFECAGEVPAKLMGSRTGVFIGCMSSDYIKRVRKSSECSELEMYLAAGSGGAGIAGRVAYTLGLQGPALTVDTACSSSLVALHLACRELRAGGCDRALAGGVNLVLSSDTQAILSRTRAFSFKGRCATFDEEADGFVRGEGCGVVVLKRLSDAISNGDRVLAVIRGSAVNQDGRSSSFTAPNGQAQEALLREALANSGIKPADVSYVEAHGTGTLLGDPVEVGALAKVYGEGRGGERPLVIGSVKTNIGHTEAAAGIAGVIKVVLSLQHEKVPRHLHFKKWNSNISLGGAPIVVPTQELDWRRDGTRRIAGISGFGLTGTNAHVLIEEAPSEGQLKGQNTVGQAIERPWQVLTLSARSEGAIRSLASRYIDRLSGVATSLPDLCYTSHVGRSHFEERLVVIGSGVEDMKERLGGFLGGRENPGVVRGRVRLDSNKSRTAFLFTGHGSQYVGMGRELYETQATFRKTMDRCDEILRSHLEKPILRMLLDPAEADSLLNKSDYIQPILCSLEYAIAQLWRTWGIEPQAVMGHSMGEYVAAVVAGIMSLEDALGLIVKRAHLMGTMTVPGGMGAINADEETVSKALQAHGGQVSIASLNGPSNTVISGEREAVKAVLREMEALGYKVKLLSIGVAGHSPLLDPILDEFERAARGMTYHEPKIPFISNLTGKRLLPEEAGASYWRNHMRQKVKFYEGMKLLLEEGFTHFVETAPGTTLLGMGQMLVPEDAETYWFPSIKAERSEWEQLLESLGGMYASGVEVDWEGFDRDYPARRKTPLPTYAFQKERYWIDESRQAQENKSSGHLLLGIRMDSACDRTEHLFESEVSPDWPGFLRDHQVYGNIIVPGAAYIEMALAAGEAVLDGPVRLECVEIEKALLLQERETRKLQLILEERDGGHVFQIFSRSTGLPGSEWLLHARGKVYPMRKGADPLIVSDALSEVEARCGMPSSGAECYTEFAKMGISYGPCFQGLRSVRRGRSESLGEIELPRERADGAKCFRFHPALMDACFHTVLVLETSQEEKAAYMPIGFDEIVVHRPVPQKLRVHTAKRSLASGSDQRMLECDIRVLSESGGLVAEFKGSRAVRTTSDALQNSMMEAKGVDSWIHELKWEEQFLTSGSKRGGDGRRWLVLSDGAGIGDHVSRSLRLCGDEVAIVKLGSGFAEIQMPMANDARSARVDLVAHQEIEYIELLERLKRDGFWPIDGAAHFWSLSLGGYEDRQANEVEVDQKVSVGSVLSLMKAFLKMGGRLPELSLITQGACQVEENCKIRVGQAPLWGLGSAVGTEFPEAKCRKIDLDPEWNDVEQKGEAIFRELVSDGNEDRIAYRRDRRFVERLVASRLPRPDGRGKSGGSVAVSSDATYLITGGLGGLGFETARWIAKAGGRHLAIVGRKRPSCEIETGIEELRKSGSNVKVMQIDVSSWEDCKEMMSLISRDMPPLRGVIHAAGAGDMRDLPQETWEGFAKVFSGKAKGAWNLHLLTRDLPLDFFVMYSSGASFMPAPGQGSYAAANSFLDALAHFRGKSGLKSLSINWGLWAEVGMAARNESKDWSKAGMGIIRPDQGVEILGRMLGCRGQLAVLPMNWARYSKARSTEFGLEFFSKLLGDGFRSGERPHSEPKADEADILRLLAEARDEGGRRALIEFIQREAVAVMGLNAGTVIEPREKLMARGMDSLMAIQFRNRLKKGLGKRYGTKIPATLIFKYPDIEKIVEFLLTEIAPEQNENDSQKEDPSGQVNPMASSQSTAENACVALDGNLNGIGAIHRQWPRQIEAGDLQLEKFLTSEEIQAAIQLPKPSPGLGPRNYLLTGATGFLGRFLCLELLVRAKDSGGKVYCIVRAGSDEKAFERLRNVFSTDLSLAGEFSDLVRDRLVVLSGDLEKPRLGLEIGTYAMLCDEVESIIHCGASVNHALPYEDLFRPNVVGTAEVIRLATKGRMKVVNYISTYAVFMKSSEKQILESEDIRRLRPEWPTDGLGFEFGYLISKWAGEVLLLDLYESFGIPVNVFRANSIMPHTRFYGQLNVPDYFVRLLSSLVYTGIAPASFYGKNESNPHFDGLPVDFIASSIVAIASTTASGMHNYHVDNVHRDDQVSLDRIVDWVISAGYPLEKVGSYPRWFELFTERLEALPETQQQQSSLLLLNHWRDNAVMALGKNLNADQFRAKVRELRPGGVEDIPHLTESLIHKCLKDLQILGLIGMPHVKKATVRKIA